MRLISGTLRSTPLPWLPVLANIEPPALRRKAATDRLVTKVLSHDRWPIHHDILNPPQLRLTSRKPLWRDMTSTDIKSQWRESWKSAPVVNAHLVDDPTIRQPGFTLPRQQWSLLNRFCTGQWHCGACRKTWHGVLQTLICAPVVRPKRCPTSSNPALLQSWTVVCPSFTLFMMLLLPGWPTMGLNRIRKKKKKSNTAYSTTVHTHDKQSIYYCVISTSQQLLEAMSWAYA